MEEREPGSTSAGTCLFVTAETMPRKGHEYDLRKVIKSGREDKVGSLDNFRNFRM
jgi:hypothetical protein